MSMIGFLLSTALLLFALVLVARAVLDLVASFASGRPSPWSIRARQVAYRLTEPVLAPVRRVLPPIRLGTVAFDLAFTVVLIVVLILRSITSNW